MGTGTVGNPLILNFVKKSLRPLKLRTLLQVKAFHCWLVFYWVLRWGCDVMTVSDRSAIIFAPHPDDETLGCGGLIALKRQQLVPVKVVILTDGRASHNGLADIQREELVQVRNQEAIAALSALGVERFDIHFLDQPDGSLKALSGTKRRDLILQLVQLLTTFHPQEVYVPHAKDRHSDHEATFELVLAAIAQTKQAFSIFQYPIWLFWEGFLGVDYQLSDLRGAFQVKIDLARSQKQQAIEAYQSQSQSLGEDMQSALPQSFLEYFKLPQEIYFKLTDSASVQDQVTSS